MRCSRSAPRWYGTTTTSTWGTSAKAPAILRLVRSCSRRCRRFGKCRRGRISVTSVASSWNRDDVASEAAFDVPIVALLDVQGDPGEISERDPLVDQHVGAVGIARRVHRSHFERLDPAGVPSGLEDRAIEVLDQDQRDVTPARGELHPMVMGRIGGVAVRADDDHADVRQIAERSRRARTTHASVGAGRGTARRRASGRSPSPVAASRRARADSVRSPGRVVRHRGWRRAGSAAQRPSTRPRAPGRGRRDATP